MGSPSFTPEQLAQISELLRKPRPKRRRGEETVQWLTTGELDRLFRVITSARDQAIFRVTYHRGLRAGEVGRIQLADLNLRTERLYVRRLKGSHSGEFHLTSKEVRALRAWLKERGADPGPLFTSRRRRGISQQMLDVLFKRYAAAAGLPPEKRHCHCLKHTCATHLLERGEPIEDVQDHLGHVNIQNTMIYAKITNVRRQARDRRLRDW